MGRLHAGEAAGATAGLPLLGQGQVVELPARVGSVGHLLVLPEDADPPADGNGCALVVPSDHDDSDSGVPAQLNRACDLLAGGVQHAYHANECQVRLGRQQRVTASGKDSENEPGRTLQGGEGGDAGKAAPGPETFLVHTRACRPGAARPRVGDRLQIFQGKN